MNNKIQIEINFTIDLNEVKNSLGNKRQLLNNESVIEYIKNNILDKSLNSATFTDISKSESGNKGFLNKKIEEFNNTNR